MPKLAQLKFPKPVSRKTLKARKDRAHRLATAKLRAAVFLRANGRCESCGKPHPVAMDHFLGGSGRRRQQQSYENTWALCSRCDSNRTHNVPSAEFWNDRFKRFAERYGYPVLAHLVKTVVPRG